MMDEADATIFSSPVKFYEKTVVRRTKSICFTATADDGDEQGIERKILESIGCDILSSHMDVLIQKVSPKQQVDQYM